MSMWSARARPPGGAMVADAPASVPPAAARLRRPTWRDRRLVLGAVLVLAAALLGARLLGGADDGVRVWSARTDLAAGVPVRSADLVATDVRLGDHAGAYVSADAPPPAGSTLTRPLTRGELLPASAVTASDTAPELRVVTVPVERFHLPADLARGERVDVHVTPRASGGSSAPTTARLLADSVVVVDVDGDSGRFGGAGAVSGVSVAVPADTAARFVGGLGAGVVDLVRVPAGAR